MAVFDVDIERQDAPVATPKDSSFGYLNRADRPEAAKIRELIEIWVSRYPSSHRQKLVRDLRQFDDDKFASAFWELTLHEWLVRTGNVVVEVEPAVPGSTKRPDFLVQAADGTQFYLEAVVSTGRSDDELSARRRMAEVWQALDQIQVSRFFLSVQHAGMPAENIPVARLRRDLQRWCDELPEDSTSAISPFVFELHGLRLSISAFPKNKPTGSSRPVAITLLPVQSHIVGEPVLKALETKARRYGDLPLPYVIAVNSLSDAADLSEMLAALYGQLTVSISRDPNDTSVEEAGRAGNGLWGHRDNPKASRVSAVLSTGKLTPWTLGQRRGMLTRNIWAIRPLPDIGSRLDEVNPNGEEELATTRGTAWHQIFELNAGWPEESDPSLDWTDVAE